MGILRTTSRALAGLWLCAGALATTNAALRMPRGDERVLWQDDFTRPRAYERRPAHAWPRGGWIRAGQEMAILAPTMAPMRQGTVAADITIQERTGASWTWAGVSFYLEPGNSWQLLLVEGPDGNRYMELLEELDGTRQAQSLPNSASLLAVEEGGDLRSWQPGQRYVLGLTLGHESVEGVVQDPATGAQWRRLYKLDSRRAVRQGRPVMVASGISGQIHSFSVTGPQEHPGDSVAVRKGKNGSVVILRDQGGTVGDRLGAAFAKEGFGVTLVAWEDLLSKRLPQGRFDIFVLADARSLPVQARDEVVGTLTTGGCVMAIGAPAATTLVAHTPEGWKDRDGWLQVRARHLERTLLRVPAEGWRRTAFKQEQSASIAVDATEGEACWKVTCNLLGWDGWYAETGDAFSEERRLLVFEGRGDSTTTDLAVECVEGDGSRWIATVPLSTAWRWHILTPADFAYWPDSPTKNRGHPGDKLRPEHITRLSFALSGSHTPRVKPGPHTYWIRNISTARDETSEVPDFRITDVEGLWPGYKLYAMDKVAFLRTAAEQEILPRGDRRPWKHTACSPVWRERGRGFRRGRAWRWIPIVEAYDSAGTKRGAVVSLMVGDAVFPNAMWANVSVASPSEALGPQVLPAVLATAKAMKRGLFLLEGGAEYFSYRRGEPMVLGAKVLNASNQPRKADVHITIRGPSGSVLFEARRTLVLPPRAAIETEWTTSAKNLDPKGQIVRTVLYEAATPIDRIEHRIDVLRDTPARPEEFVRVEGSMFTLGGKPWYFQGINYWPTWMAGYPNLNQRSRECYDPEIIERDLAWLQAVGVNVVSAIAAIPPPDPDDAKGYRDQLDFVERCLRHGIRCYFTVPNGRAYAGADFSRIKDFIEKAGLRNHPGIMCWELAWEPIEGAWGHDLEKFGADWNRWIIEQYGSVDHAVGDWGFDPRTASDRPVPVPTWVQCTTSGPWNGFVAAFARAFSDLISREYGKVARQLRAWDPNHLISFRGGACGIPSGGTFAHIHSVGVARHLDFLCPEGYNLQTGGWASPTPADDIRKGGLVTLYYRHVSREKPVVWMEFGFTVNGFGEAWTPERFRVRPAELEHQRLEIERFYAMMLESGARGGAPWWLPGGFRLGENSDFGFVEPDGSERPVCRVFRENLPRFAQVRHATPDAWLTIDLEGERCRAWQLYAPSYLDLIKADKTVGLRTDGTGTDSANCPLVSVSGTPCNGHNPPRFLNAEFDRLEVQLGNGPWREVHDGDVLDVPAGAGVHCRASVGNIGEAKWLASSPGGGAVRLAVRSDHDLLISAPIAEDVPYLGTGEVPTFTLVSDLEREVRISFEMEAQGRTRFGERRTITLRPRR